MVIRIYIITAHQCQRHEGRDDSYWCIQPAYLLVPAMFKSLLYQLCDFIAFLFFMPDYSGTYIGPLFRIKNGTRNGFTSQGPEHAICDEKIRFADHIYVTKMEWRKSTVAPFHEFVVFHVEDPYNEDTEVFMIQRGTHNNSKERQKKGQTNGASSASFTSLSNTCKSDPSDAVIFSTAGNPGFISTLVPSNQLVCQLTGMAGHRISVPMVTCLAYFLNQQAEYNLFTTQCYWFAALAYEIVKAKCDGLINFEGPGYQNRGTLDGTNVGVKPKPPTPELKRNFDTAWAEYQACTAQIRNDKEDEQRMVSIHRFA